MQYPIELRFKLLTFGQRVTATDGSGNLLMFIKQKMFKLREKVEIYSDAEQHNLIFRIEADRVLDFSASYSFTDAQGNPWGSIRRRGMRSLWSARYDVTQDEGRLEMTIEEESPMKKVLESLLGEIPVVGFIAAYLLNPSYLVKNAAGTPVLRLVKQPAFLEGKFTLEKLEELPEDDELRALMSLLMLVLLERRRG